MSMTKRWISDLTDRANAGDGAAQTTLRGVGLWESEEDYDRERERFEAENREAEAYEDAPEFDDFDGNF